MLKSKCSKDTSKNNNNNLENNIYDWKLQILYQVEATLWHDCVYL